MGIPRLNGLDLFSGIGGNSLGLRDYVKTIAYCEADRHAQSVLLSRMHDGQLEPAPIWDDVTTLRAEHFDVRIDIIIAGFPCQDISVAGHGVGLAGKRSGLFFEIMRLAEEIKPTFIFLENVPAIRTRGLDTVIRTISGLGYDCRWGMLSAADVGANHIRERWFLLANASGERRQQITCRTHGYEGENGWWTTVQADKPKCNGKGYQFRTMANTDCQGLEIGKSWDARQQSPVIGKNWWGVEPDVGRVAFGVQQRVYIIKRLGNAVVPLQAKEAFERLMGLK